MAMAPVSVANDGLRGTAHEPLTEDSSQFSWVQCERTERIRRSSIAATETSWVPLQESTAKRCVFFVYIHQAIPRRRADIIATATESLLSRWLSWQWMQVSEANDGNISERELLPSMTGGT